MPHQLAFRHACRQGWWRGPWGVQEWGWIALASRAPWPWQTLEARCLQLASRTLIPTEGTASTKSWNRFPHQENRKKKRKKRITLMFTNTSMNLESLCLQATASIKRWTLSNSHDWGNLIAYFQGLWRLPWGMDHFQSKELWATNFEIRFLVKKKRKKNDAYVSQHWHNLQSFFVHRLIWGGLLTMAVTGVTWLPILPPCWAQWAFLVPTTLRWPGWPGELPNCWVDRSR